MASIIPIVIFVTIFFSGSLLASSNIISPRIYGGHPAIREEIPYIVLIKNENKQLCAGSILNQQWILTVAHCVANKTGLEVYAGLIHSTNEDNGDLQVSEVQEVIIHPDYDYRLDTIDNDVAVLLLATNLIFNDVVQPIEIISENELSDAVKNRRSGIISGWGHSEDAFQSKILRTAEVVLLSNEECLDDIPPECHAFNSKVHLCSGPLTGPQKGAGLYDDGGPLVVNNKLAGVILHGEHERSDNDCHLSSIYARVSYFREFLSNYIILPEPTTEQPSYLEPCLLEIEISLELLSETFNSNLTFLGRSYLFKYNLWFFGSRNIESHNFKPTTETDNPHDYENYSDVSDSDSEYSSRYPTGEETSQSASQSTTLIFEENLDEFQTAVSRNLEVDNEEVGINPEKLILNIQVWTSSQEAEEGIGFRLFPNSPVDCFILLSARNEEFNTTVTPI